MNHKKEILQSYENAVSDLTDYFVWKYFRGVVSDEYWVADEIGGVYYINDRFFNVSDMVDFIKYNYKQDEMFDYYDYALEQQEQNKTPINIKNWKKLCRNKAGNITK